MGPDVERFLAEPVIAGKSRTRGEQLSEPQDGPQGHYRGATPRRWI
jgi:hypothetical protein